MKPYRGIGGYRRRENDEGHSRPQEIRARYAGVCAETGAQIQPGDLVRYDRITKRTVLIQSAPGSRYVSDVFTIGGREYYRNKGGRCEDAPGCGCCTI